MKDKDFEKLMDSWADHEIESAPDLRPTAEMKLMVDAMRPTPAGRTLPRWLTAGTALASVAVLILLAWVLFPTDTQNRIPVWQVAQREGFPAENGVIMEEPPESGGKGPSRGLVALQKLQIQFQISDSPIVRAVDLQTHPDIKVTLSTTDNYRLLLEPAEEHYLYFFQLTAAEQLIQLFPNETASPTPNPIPAGQELVLPAPPNWFYLDQTPGRERLYILASAAPLPDLEKLYTRYRPSTESAGQPELLSELLQLLESYREAPADQVQLWTFSFTHQ